MSLPERIESRIDRSGECHIWTGSVNRAGYGRVGFEGKVWLAHRLVYTLEVGPIPPGMTIDHVATRGCTSTSCVNVEHLEAVTMRENTLRGDTLAAANTRKTHCPQGHPYDDANTYHSHGRRTCKRCTIARVRARREAARS